MMKIMVNKLPWISEDTTRFVRKVSRGKGALSFVPINLSFCLLAPPFKNCFFLGAIKIISFGAEYIRIII